MFDAEAIELWSHLDKTGLREPAYCHLRAAALTDVVPPIRRTDRVLKRGPHVLPKTDLSTGRAESGHVAEIVPKLAEIKA